MMSKLYALYENDVFIDCGTVKELSERHNISQNSIRSSISHRKKREANGAKSTWGYSFYLIEDDEL